MDPEALPLRDIHLPDPVSWWPPAVGWWGVSAALLVFLSVLLWRRWRRQHKRIIRSARIRLDEIEAAYKRDQDPQELIRELSRLARRIAMTIAGRKEAAALTGDNWLQYLDQWNDNAQFMDGPGRMLKEAPYQRPGSLDPGALPQIFRAWLDSVSRRPSRTPD